MNMSFINSDIFKKFVLFSIKDVDDFVLSEATKLRGHHEHWDIRNAKRVWIELEWVEGEYEEREISEEEYNLFSQMASEMGSTSNYYIKLNYEDFEAEFPLQEIEDWYGDEWIYATGFFKTATNWIENTEGDLSKKLRLKDLLEELNRSTSALSKISYYWFENSPLNAIQKEVILIHLRFNSSILGELNKKYLQVFPDIFETELPQKEIPKNPYPDLFKTYEVYECFMEYTKKHIVDPYSDYSYLYQRLLETKKIHLIKHKPFISWLCNEGFISERLKESFLDKTGLESLRNSRSAQRENNFNNIFNI